MKPEKLIITTKVGDRTKTELWDTSSPLGLGFPFRWVLEQGPEGLRVRDLSGAANQVRKDGAIDFPSEYLDNGKSMPLPGTESGKQISLTVRKAHIPKPAYAARGHKEGVVGSVPQLMVFEGVRRTLMNSQGVHSAYVAYSKSRPVFTVYHNSGGFRIKPLLNGVHLKLKGEKPIPGKAGEFWDVTREQMTRATIVRGWYWWRFSLIEAPAFVADDDDTDTVILAENRVFRNAFIGVSAMLTAAVIFTLFQAPPEEKKEEILPPEVVKLYMKKVPMNVQKGKVEVAVAKPTKDIDHASKDEGRKSGENKANKKVGHVDVKHEAAKPKAAIEAKTPSPPSSHVSVSNSKAPPGPKVAKPEKTGAEKVAESANALRKAMGAASTLTEKDVVKDVSGGQPNVGDLFANKGAAYSPTEVKAGRVNGSASVHGVGGGGVGGGGGSAGGGDVAAGEGGGSVGYGEGDKGLVAGKGGGFVSLDNGGSEVEEGLTKEEVGRVIHEHMSEVRYCHEAALLANPKVEGKLMLKFVINAGGNVETAGIQSSNLTDHSLESCIIRRLVTWKFPHPKGGVKVNVAYPFLFKLLGGV